MKKFQWVVLMSAVMFALTGCGMTAKKYDKNTLIVKGNGSLEEIAVEDFKGASVSAGDLEGYIDEQISKYNSESGKKVKKTYIDTEDMSKVKLAISYEDMESFNGFNLLDCKYVKYEEADKDLLTGSFSSAEGKSVKASDFTDVEKAKVLCLSEKTNVIVKGKLLYYNDQVKVKDGVVSTTGKDNAVMIIK